LVISYARLQIAALRARFLPFFGFFLGTNFDLNIEVTEVKLLDLTMDSRNKRRGNSKIAKKNLLV